jgi:hypothetical protein
MKIWMAIKMAQRRIEGGETIVMIHDDTNDDIYDNDQVFIPRFRIW